MFRQVHRSPHVENRRYHLPQQRGQVRGGHVGKLDKFSTSLDTVQQVLGVVRSTAPYIEKYGPIVQRIPTMYRMYKAIKAVDTSDGSDKSTNESSKNNDSSSIQKKPSNEYPTPTLYI